MGGFFPETNEYDIPNNKSSLLTHKNWRKYYAAVG